MKCKKCKEVLKYVRSERGIMNTTIYTYYCEHCRKEVKVTWRKDTCTFEEGDYIL
jgi:hypothetical protein